MAFNIGLSGLRASQVDLDVTGNNIANASTVGFKGSKAQFGDLYSSGFLSSGQMSVGSGVKVQDIKQSFAQGSISGTQNGLDMAIDGDGFFVLSNNGQVQYSRAGQFSIDKDGFLVNNQDMKVRGYLADDDGNLSGVRDDLQIDSDNLAPRRTTRFDSEVNLDSRDPVLEVTRQEYEANVSSAEETFTFEYEDGRSVSVTINGPDDETSAQAIAAKLNAVDGVSASARTEYELSSGLITPGSKITIGTQDYNIPSGPEVLDDEDAFNWLQDSINSDDNHNLSATRTDDDDDPTNGYKLKLMENRGADVSVSVIDAGGNAVSLNPATGDTLPHTEVGEVNNLFLDGSISEFSSSLGSGGLVDFESKDVSTTNSFDPEDQRTYNHATSSTIYDSLGNPHTMTQFFVKESPEGGDSRWAMYVQIDGEDVGDPSLTTGEPTRARYNLVFNSDGSLASDNDILISNWTPKDSAGEPNGADGPLPLENGGGLPIADPPVSSNFAINLAEMTQFGSAFGVINQSQNGYTTGRLSGLDVSGEGVIFARYSNGQSQNLGQVALATFANTDGLTPVGDTNWVETFESGPAVIGAPGTGTLGSISASSVEESNVDLSQELVNLIIAQRNYQANAKTIETSDAVTQTIINLR